MDARSAFASDNLRPPAAHHLHGWPQFRHEFPVMPAAGGQRFGFPAMLQVSEKCGMDFALALQPHKKSVIALVLLVNAADA